MRPEPRLAAWAAPRQKTALIIRHVPYEGVAGYRDPIEQAGYDIARIDVTDPAFSALDLSAPDLLVMMGGPMGVYEQDGYPWIACQMRRLAKRIDVGAPTLGVCFGAQMIAAAMGSAVFAGPQREVGFHPIQLTGAGRNSPLKFIAETPILHWHGDTFHLPDNVELLASSHIYDHQAFRRGRNLLALQFHAEMGEDERFDAWLEEWPDAIVEAGLTREDFKAQHDQLGPRAVAAGRAMIGEWLDELNI